MIKNVVTVSLMIFIIAVVAVLGGAVFNQNKTANNSIGDNPVTGVTQSQVAQHNTANNCWMIISNKVYNVTSYIPVHPGGAGTIIPYCGKDGTVAFDTKGGDGSHPQSARNLLVNYYVGNLSK